MHTVLARATVLKEICHPHLQAPTADDSATHLEPSSDTITYCQPSKAVSRCDTQMSLVYSQKKRHSAMPDNGPYSNEMRGRALACSQRKNPAPVNTSPGGTPCERQRAHRYSGTQEAPDRNTKASKQTRKKQPQIITTGRKRAKNPQSRNNASFHSSIISSNMRSRPIPTILNPPLA
jgi:hypothetical protein